MSDDTSQQINWITSRRKLADLKHWDKNPRKISPEKIEMLKERIRARGFHDVIKIDLHDVILSGNCRKEVLVQLGIEEVNVLIPSRELTDQEKEKVGLESNLHDGQFDFEKLTKIDEEVLKNIGFNQADLSYIFESDKRMVLDVLGRGYRNKNIDDRIAAVFEVLASEGKEMEKPFESEVFKQSFFDKLREFKRVKIAQ